MNAISLTSLTLLISKGREFTLLWISMLLAALSPQTYAHTVCDLRTTGMNQHFSLEVNQIRFTSTSRYEMHLQRNANSSQLYVTEPRSGKFWKTLPAQVHGTHTEKIEGEILENGYELLVELNRIDSSTIRLKLRDPIDGVETNSYYYCHK